MKADSGAAYINGKTVWDNAYLNNADIGYLPGEIYFPDKMTGMGLIRFTGEMRGVKNLDKAKQLLERFELNANIDVKRMSKGMKQKVGIVCAFMHDPKILILDEPTNGLDPLMQSTFIDLVMEEKKAGKTILMSSHMFAEVEKSCDRVAIVKQGEIITQVNMSDIKKSKDKTFKIKFAADGESKRFAKEHMELDLAEVNHEKNRVRVRLNDKEINGFLAIMPNYKVQYISEIKLTLEDYFMQFYSNKNKTEVRKNVV